MPSSRIRVLALGLGPIGCAVCREIADAADLELAGAVDPAPGLAGRDLGRLLRRPALDGVRVLDSLEAFRGKRPHVAAHMAASRFPVAAAHIRELVEHEVPVVSTCEELIAASVRFPKEAAALHRAAQRAQVPVLATGVNPGFVMDLLPAALTNVCVSVRRLRVTRHVDTATRRAALQEKTGAGITRAEFSRRAREGRVGHVGLRDSLLFLMEHIPVQGEVGQETLRPLMAGKSLRRGIDRIPKGCVAGVHQTVRARDPAGKIVASFDLKMAFGLEDPHDEIRIDGDPSFLTRIEGGIPGDRATVGAMLSGLRFAVDAPPGLGM